MTNELCKQLSTSDVNYSIEYKPAKNRYIKKLVLFSNLTIQVLIDSDFIELSSTIKIEGSKIPSRNTQAIQINREGMYTEVWQIVICDYIRYAILKSRLCKDLDSIENIVNGMCMILGIGYVEHSLKYEKCDIVDTTYILYTWFDNCPLKVGYSANTGIVFRNNYYNTYVAEAHDCVQSAETLISLSDDTRLMSKFKENISTVYSVVLGAHLEILKVQNNRAGWRGLIDEDL